MSEIAHALGDGVPVIGLKTWPLTIKGDGDPIEEGIIQADNPVDAVEKAMAAVAARSNSDQSQIRG